MSGNSVPSPRATEPVVRQPGQEVLDFGAIVTAKLVQNVSVDLEQISTESNATIDKMNRNNESQKALEQWTGTIVDWGTPLAAWPADPGAGRTWYQQLEQEIATKLKLSLAPPPDLIVGSPEWVKWMTDALDKLAYSQLPLNTDKPTDNQLLTWNAILNGESEFKATKSLENAGLDLSADYNAYRYGYTDLLGNPRMEYSVSPPIERSGKDFSGLVAGDLVKSDDGNYYRLYADLSGNLAALTLNGVPQQFVTKPTAVQIAAWSTALGPDGPVDKTQNLLLDGVAIDPASYDAAKFMAGGQAGYSRLPVKELTTLDFTGMEPGTLFRYQGKYLVLTGNKVAEVVTSPLAPAVEVKGTDFSTVEPGKLAHSDNGKFYLVTNAHEGVEVDGQLQMYVDAPSADLLLDWKNQYLKMNNELGKTTLDEQVRLQSLTGEYSKLVGFLSSVISVLARMREKVVGNL